MAVIAATHPNREIGHSRCLEDGAACTVLKVINDMQESLRPGLALSGLNELAVRRVVGAEQWQGDAPVNDRAREVKATAGLNRQHTLNSLPTILHRGQRFSAPVTLRRLAA